jgi:hypothetical protein
MSSFVQFVELVAVFIPDFLTLGLFTLALFNLCCIAKTIRVAGTLDTESALGIALALAYLVTVATNILSPVQAPARSTITTVVQSKASVDQAGCEPSSGTREAQPVEHGGVVVES